MTTYGTISTGSSPGTSRVEFISRAKERIKARLGSRRPWREMLHRNALSIPSSVSEAVDRVRTNFAYFRMNYDIIVLFIVFLGLLWHPVSLIVLMVMIAWLFLYFLPDVPLIVAGRTIDDWVVLVVLSVVMIAALRLTHAAVNINVSVLLGLAVALVHAVFRKTDDLCLDEEAMGFDGDGLTRPLSAPSS